MTLRIDDAHFERRRPQCQFPPDLAEANYSKLPSVKSYQPGDARPITIRRVLALVSRRCVTGSPQLLHANEISVLIELARQGKHQGESLLGCRNVGSTSNRYDLNIFSLARGAIDLRGCSPDILSGLACPAGTRNFFLANRHGFHNDHARASGVCQQLV